MKRTASLRSSFGVVAAALSITLVPPIAAQDLAKPIVYSVPGMAKTDVHRDIVYRRDGAEEMKAAMLYSTRWPRTPAFMGEDRHPEVSMHTHPLAAYMAFIRAGDWNGVAGLMLSSVEKLARIGAQFAICPDNTIHQAFELVVPRSPIPWRHIAQAVGREAQARGLKRLAVAGTSYLMTGPVYPQALGALGIECRIPGEADRERIDAIVFQELVNGVFREDSRLFFNQVFKKMKDQGCDGAVLGCTEIPLLVNPDDCPLPTLDSTRLLARDALRESLKGD